MAEGSRDQPGRPLWEAAEHARTERDWTIEQLAAVAGIGRMTYNRLATSPKPPQARTVRKIADAIGMPLTEAIRLSGLLTGQQARPNELDEAVRILREHLDNLREVGSATGRTLGEMLVDLRLAVPDELRIGVEQAVRELDRRRQDAG